MPSANHIARLIKQLIGSVFVYFELNFRVIYSHFVVNVQNFVRELVIFRAAAFIRTAEIERLTPVITDRRPLKHKILQKFAYLSSRERAARKIVLIESEKRAVEPVSERTHLIRVEALRNHKVNIHNLRGFVKIRGRTVTYVFRHSAISGSFSDFSSAFAAASA